MSQLPLFAQSRGPSSSTTHGGRILYTPVFLPADRPRLFDEVRGAVAWEAQRRWMYDREVDVPRLVGHFPLAPEGAHVPDAIRAATRQVIAATGVAFIQELPRKTLRLPSKCSSTRPTVSDVGSRP